MKSVVVFLIFFVFGLCFEWGWLFFCFKFYFGFGFEYCFLCFEFYKVFGENSFLIFCYFEDYFFIEIKKLAGIGLDDVVFVF